MFKLGIDFGTSYTAAAVQTPNGVQVIEFGSARQFRTAAYFPETLPDLTNFSFDPELTRRREVLLRDMRRKLKDLNEDIDKRRSVILARSLSDEERRLHLELVPKPIYRTDFQLSEDAGRIVRREWLEYETKRLAAAPRSLEQALFGEDAVRAFVDDSGGKLLESPKSMLAFPFDLPVRLLVRNVISTILEHVRLTASAKLGQAVRSAVIGRPIVFKAADSIGAEGRAVALLREAADMAGFDEIELLEEPVAAALEVHGLVRKRAKFMLLDVGGGTTDITFGQLGGTLAPEIEGSVGLPKGGTDVDRDLSLSRLMPYFGRNHGVPNHYFFEAASVHDFPAQKRFRERVFNQWPSPFDRRLAQLARGANTTVLNERAESAKIGLSSQKRYRTSLTFPESGTGVDLTQSQLAVVMMGFLSDVERIIFAARASLGGEPEVVVATGGMSQSPQVEDVLRNVFTSSKIMRADPSFAVVRGLALHAGRK